MLIEYTLKLTSDKAPEFKEGLGKGVVCIQEVDFKGATEEDLKSPAFQRQISDMGDQLLNKHFTYEIKVTEKQHALIIGKD